MRFRASCSRLQGDAEVLGQSPRALDENRRAHLRERLQGGAQFGGRGVRVATRGSDLGQGQPRARGLRERFALGKRGQRPIDRRLGLVELSRGERDPPHRALGIADGDAPAAGARDGEGLRAEISRMARIALGESCQLSLSADQGRVGRGRCAAPRRERCSAGGPGGGGGTLEDLEIEPLCLRLGLDAELLLQYCHARLVLAEGGGPPALAHVEAHERAMDLFLERVDREQARGGMGGLFHPSCLAVALDEPAERVDGQLAEPRALDVQPLLEGRRRDVHAVEQRTLIERHGRLERLRRSTPHEPLECRDVELERGRGQRDRIALHEERARIGGEDAAQAHHRLAQALPRLALPHVAPEESRERLARVRASGPHREVGQERLRLARGQGARAVVRAEQEAAEELEGEPRHRPRAVAPAFRRRQATRPRVVLSFRGTEEGPSRPRRRGRETVVVQGALADPRSPATLLVDAAPPAPEDPGHDDGRSVVVVELMLCSSRSCPPT